MALSEEARQLRNAQSRKGHQNFMLKKADEYGVDKRLPEKDRIRAARRIYEEAYWEKKASEKAGD